MKAAKVHSKTVLVTGCSSGIGKAVAIYLRRTGWDVYPTARSEADLKELRSNGFEALYLDLSDSSSINSCVLSLLHNCKYGVGALINNAGMAIPGSVEDLSRKDLREQFEVNVFGLQELTNDFSKSRIGKNSQYQLYLWSCYCSYGRWILCIQICP